MKQPPFLCVPCGGSVSTRFFIFTWTWTPAGTRWKADPTPNRLDISRSVLLHEAMGQGRPIWQWDADVVAFNQSYEEQLQLIEEDVRAGYDAVVAPHSSLGRVMIQPEDPEQVDARPTVPFAIKGGFNGAWYMALSGLNKLQEIGWHETSDGRKTPMYCTFGLPGPIEEHPDYAITEDFDLSLRFRAAGGKICCDPRLKVAHLNKRDEVVDVQELNRREELQRQAIANHERDLRMKWAIEKGREKAPRAEATYVG